MSEIMLTFSELCDKNKAIFKKIEIQPDGSLKKSSQATISQGIASTVEMSPEDFAQYLTDLSYRPATCIVPAIWPAGDDFLEYDITLAGKEDPENGVVSRSSKFFRYANNDSISLMLLDIDGDYDAGQVDKFISLLENRLENSFISNGSKKIMQFRKASPSARVKVSGRTGTGLHIYVPVRNMRAELLEQIFKFAWLNSWSSHIITKAATVEARSIIDESVKTASRLIFEANPEVTGHTELVELVERECQFIDGSVIDCDSAIAILKDETFSYNSKWQAYKQEIFRSPDYVSAKIAAEERETLRLAATGIDHKKAGHAATLLVSDHIITSDDFLTRSNGSQVSVYDILVDRDSYRDEKTAKGFQDPISPKSGTNKAMIMADADSVRLKSFAHGGLYYQLRFSYEGLERWLDEASVDEVLECWGSFASQSTMTTSQLSRLTKIAAKKVGSTATDLKADVKISSALNDAAIRQADAEEDGEKDPCALLKDATQGEIATDMVRHLGQCRSYGSFFYVAGPNHIWNQVRDDVIREKVSIRFSHCLVCKRGGDYTAIHKLVMAKESAYVEEWPMIYGIPCSSSFLQVGQDCVGSVGSTHGEGVGASWTQYCLDLGCRFKLKFNPDWSLATPYWDKVLANVVNVRAFQQAFGLALCGYLTRGGQMAMILKGEGGTGKGTTNKVLTAMLPTGCTSSVSFEDMCDMVKVHPLVHSVVNFIPEMKKGGKAQATEGFKMATGGDSMRARRLYMDAVDFRPNAAQVININDWPVLDSAGEEIRRRVGHFIIEFRKNHVEKIDNLEERIIAKELPGVLAWAIDGIVDYFRNGIDDQHSLELFGKWVSSFDPVSLFIEECMVFDPAERVKRSVVLDVFSRFCVDSGYYVQKKGQVSVEMEKMFGAPVKYNGHWVYAGATLNDEGKRLAKLLGISK